MWSRFVGKIYKARRKTHASRCNEHGKSEKDVKNLRQEIGILRKLDHFQFKFIRNSLAIVIVSTLIFLYRVKCWASHT
jgi:hypothetical protein